MKEIFYGVYDFGGGAFNERLYMNTPIAIFAKETDRENWINCPSADDIEWEESLDYNRKAITTEQAADILADYCCDWITKALKENDVETIKTALEMDSFELPIVLVPGVCLNHVTIPKKYRDDVMVYFYDD